MRHTLSFYGSVSNSSRNTFVSKLLKFPYTIEHIRVKYALGHEGTVQHKFFVSDDDSVVTSGEPSGNNILEQYGNVDYVVGDDDVMDMDDNTIVDRMSTWIKVLAINADSVSHTVNVLITIEDYRIHPAMGHMKEILKEQASSQLMIKEPLTEE